MKSLFFLPFLVYACSTSHSNLKGNFRASTLSEQSSLDRYPAAKPGVDKANCLTGARQFLRAKVKTQGEFYRMGNQGTTGFMQAFKDFDKLADSACVLVPESINPGVLQGREVALSIDGYGVSNTWGPNYTIMRGTVVNNDGDKWILDVAGKKVTIDQSEGSIMKVSILNLELPKVKTATIKEHYYWSVFDHQGPDVQNEFRAFKTLVSKGIAVNHRKIEEGTLVGSEVALTVTGRISNQNGPELINVRGILTAHDAESWTVLVQDKNYIFDTDSINEMFLGPFQ